MRNSQFWQAAWDSPETRSNRFYGQMQKDNRSGCAEGDQYGTRDSLCIPQTENHQGDRKDGYGGCPPHKPTASHSQNAPSGLKNNHARMTFFTQKDAEFFWVRLEPPFASRRRPP